VRTSGEAAVLLAAQIVRGAVYNQFPFRFLCTYRDGTGLLSCFTQYCLVPIFLSSFGMWFPLGMCDSLGGKGDNKQTRITFSVSVEASLTSTKERKLAATKATFINSCKSTTSQPARLSHDMARGPCDHALYFFDLDERSGSANLLFRSDCPFYTDYECLCDFLTWWRTQVETESANGFRSGRGARPRSFSRRKHNRAPEAA
jgi:hypothetical protein